MLQCFHYHLHFLWCLRRLNLHSNVEVVALLTLCTNFQVFAHFALQSSPIKLYFWYLSCKHFPEITHQYILFAPLFLHLKHFETSSLLCVVKRILLDIGFTLRYSLVLLSQTSNFPYSLKKSVSCVKLLSLKNFTLSLNEAPKVHYFCFLLLIQSSAVQQKSNKATLPNNKTFSTVKLALWVQSLCLLLHHNVFVFNISDNCWKSSYNLWTLPNHNSRITLGFRFPSMLQRVRSFFYRSVLKTKRSGETTGKCSLWHDG